MGSLAFCRVPFCNSWELEQQIHNCSEEPPSGDDIVIQSSSAISTSFSYEDKHYSKLLFSSLLIYAILVLVLLDRGVAVASCGVRLDRERHKKNSDLGLGGPMTEKKHHHPQNSSFNSLHKHSPPSHENNNHQFPPSLQKQPTCKSVDRCCIS